MPPSVAPSDTPSQYPSGSPSQPPSAGPSQSPSQPPTEHPSTPPTAYPTSPTLIPTFMDNNYNETIPIQIIFNQKDFETIIENLDRNDKLIEKDVIYVLKLSIIGVRFDLTNIDQIDCQLINITYSKTDDNDIDASEKHIRQNYAGASVSLSIWEMVVSFDTDRELEGFTDDLDHIQGHFDENLMLFWNVSNQNISSLIESIGIVVTTTIIPITTDISPPSTQPTIQPTEIIDSDEDGDSFTTGGDLQLVSLAKLEDYYYFILIGTIIFFSILSVLGSLESKINHNDLLTSNSILVIGMYFMDVLSDYFFVIQVYLTYDSDAKDIGFVVFISSLTFILIPVISNFVQLHQEVQLWLYDPESKLCVNSWIQNNLRTLYALSILFGSAHSAVLLCNCNIFQLHLFNMGLNRRQKAIFKNKRLWSTVLLENVPQLGKCKPIDCVCPIL